MENLKDILNKVADQDFSDDHVLEMIKQLNKGAKQKETYSSKIPFAYNNLILKNHTIGSRQVMMGVAHLSLMVNKLVAQCTKGQQIKISKFNLLEPFILEPGENGEIQILQNELEKNGEIYSGCIINSTGKQFKAGFASFQIVPETVVDPINVKEIQLVSSEQLISGRQLYKKQLEVEVVYGLPLQNVKHIIKTDKGYVGIIELSEEVKKESNLYYLHPSVIDSSFLTATADLAAGYVPLFIKQFDVFPFQTASTTFYCDSVIQKYNDEIQVMDFTIYNENGQCIVSCKGFTSKKVHYETTTTTPKKLEANRSINLEKQSEMLVSTTNAQPEDRKNNSSSSDSNQLQELIQNFIARKIGEATGTQINLDEIFEKNFMELGADSKNLIGISKTLEDEIGIELYPTLFFEYQNVKELSAYFLDEYSDNFQQYFVKQGLGIKNEITVPYVSKNADVTKTNVSSVKKLFKIDADPIASSADRHFIYNGNTYSTSDIAIIGMSAKLPKSDTLDEFWKNIQTGECLTGEIPLDHFDYEPWYDKNCTMEERKINCKWGGFLNNVDKFDAAFFNISPHEAQLMDPQLRILLEEMYASAEDAGIINRIRKTKTGVFVGICSHDYSDNAKAVGKIIHPYDGTGNSMTMFPNRASFFFDISGPSYPIDTACSSSLVALHSACRAIQAGDCEMAFVAGTNLLLSPDHYVYFSKLGVLSKKGITASFDESADGYVPGEAVASILIKPLQKAIEDNDNIHAVIKGIATGHGGYTNTITAPSPNKEADVIMSAWNDGNINPETIGYVEAHGTGTKLGDPIEIDGLKIAFRKKTKNLNFCYVGSTKANIGHTEGSAGITGLLKVILCMKNKVIPPIANFKKLNSFIQLDKSALKINTELTPWETIDGVRRAGVSSFGFGGAYAHVVLEDFEFLKSPVNDQQEKLIFIISAKNETSLHLNAKNLLSYFQNNIIDQQKLRSISYTLQSGREAMLCRMAFIAATAEEVINKLTSFFVNKKEIQESYLNKKSSSIISLIEEEDRFYLEQLIRNKKLEKILKLWLSGTDIPWKDLYPQLPQIISIPTYGFNRQRYWYDLPQGIETQAAENNRVVPLHPLLDKNQSTLKSIRFSKQFLSTAFFLKDHKVNNKMILPGVAAIEMFIASAELAKDSRINKIENVIWKAPLELSNGSKKAWVDVVNVKDSNSLYLTLTALNDNEELITASCNTSFDERLEQFEAMKFNIQEILLRTNLIKQKEELYSDFCKAGLCLGKSMQGVTELYGNDKEAISRISLPPHVSDQFKSFKLHPSIMDSCLHTVIGIQNKSNQFIGLPFSIEKLEILGEIKKEMYAYATLGEETSGSKSHRSFDIFLLNKEGECVVSIKKFTVLNLESNKPKPEINASPDQLTYLTPGWEESFSDISVFEKHKAKIFVSGDKSPWTYLDEKEKYSIVIGDFPETMNTEGEKDINCIHIVTIPDNKLEDPISSLIALAGRIKAWSEKVKGRINFTCAICMNDRAREKDSLTHMFTAFFRSLNLEEPRLRFKCISIDNGTLKESNIHKIIINESFADNDSVRYINNKRFINIWKQTIPNQESMIDIKEGCQYMITGGTGGIGRILTRHLVKRKANIILLGRKKYTKKELQAMFPDAMEHQIDYYECDITSYDQVTGVKDQFYKKNKSLTGIIHCAGITNDKVFSQLTSEEIIQVMEPKIKGFDCIDLVFKEANLDFILLFSSLSSVLGNVGQSAYSAANGYLDGMARERNKMKVAGERKGLTVSVNWPFWEEGGMQLSELGRQLLLSIIGQSTLNTSEAIRAFETAIRAPYEQMLVSYSNNQKIVELINKQRRFEFSSSPLETKITDAVTIPKGAQVNQITFQLKKIVADILKINIDDIDDETELSELGLDSVVGMQMVEKMLSTFGSRLSPTILFEYPTIKEISAYLLENDFHINEPDTTANGEKNMDFNTVSQHILKQEQDHHDSFFDGMEKLVLEGETGNIEIFVKGTGEPVLFLSGFGMMSNIWKNQLQAFSGRYKCLFAHLPLHGASTLKMDGIYFEKIAEEIKKGLLHHESGRITVIGWSMGGMIAQILTHKYPEIFSRMVLVNSSAGIKEGSAWSLESNLLNYKKDIEGLFTLQKEDGLSEVTKALCLVQKSQTLNLKGKLMYGKAFLGFDYKKCLQEINVPTLVIGSKHDTMIPLDDSFHLSTTIPNTEFILFNKSGHFPFITESNKFNNIVLENLNQKN